MGGWICSFTHRSLTRGECNVDAFSKVVVDDEEGRMKMMEYVLRTRVSSRVM